MNALTWAARILIGLSAAGLLIWSAGEFIEAHSRRRTQRDIDQAVALVSKLPGPGQPQPSGVSDADDTGVGLFDAVDVRWLRSIGAKGDDHG